MTQKHIFVSYHHSDSDFAKTLIKKIKGANFETWIDKAQLHGGADWRESIDVAIKNAIALVVIMTPEAKASDYVTYEWAYAWGAGVKVIPVLYKDTKLHPRLETLHYINFTNPRSRRWNTLIKSVKMAEQQKEPIPYPPPPISKESEEDFEVLRKEIVYEYLPDGKSMFERKHLKIQMLKDDVKSYMERYRWTGKGKCIVKTLTEDFTIINQRKADEGNWDYFDVMFPYPLEKGEVIDFTIEWELYDEEGTAIPFLTTMIERETKSLLLQVNLPFEPRRAYYLEYENYTDIEPSVRKRIYWSSAARNLSYEITEPQKKHKYSIRWYNQ